MNGYVSVPLYLDLAAVFLGGLSGSLLAVRRHFSLTGLIALAVAAGLGGGILRDVLLQSGPPVALTRAWYLPTVLAAAGIGFLFGSVLGRFRRPIIIMDAVWLGLYAVVGAQKALALGLSGFSAILIGAITSTGGSLLMDLIAGQQPELVQPGPIAHFGAVVGAVIYVVMAHWLDLPSLVAMVVTVAMVFLIRAAAIRFGIPVPTALDLPSAISKVKAKPRGTRGGKGGAKCGKGGDGGNDRGGGHDRGGEV